jgi:hypothetical protein
VEARTKDVCIKVDNKQFVLEKSARMTLDGAVAYLDVAIRTGAYQELNAGMLLLLNAVMAKHQDNDQQDKEGW